MSIDMNAFIRDINLSEKDIDDSIKYFFKKDIKKEVLDNGIITYNPIGFTIYYKKKHIIDYNFDSEFVTESINEEFNCKSRFSIEVKPYYADIDGIRFLYYIHKKYKCDIYVCYHFDDVGICYMKQNNITFFDKYYEKYLKEKDMNHNLQKDIENNNEEIKELYLKLKKENIKGNLIDECNSLIWEFSNNIEITIKLNYAIGEDCIDFEYKECYIEFNYKLNSIKHFMAREYKTKEELFSYLMEINTGEYVLELENNYVYEE